MKILDITSKELDFSLDIYTNEYRIDISKLQTGIYFVRYEIDGKIYNEKFVKY